MDASTGERVTQNYESKSCNFSVRDVDTYYDVNTEKQDVSIYLNHPAKKGTITIMKSTGAHNIYLIAREPLTIVDSSGTGHLVDTGLENGEELRLEFDGESWLTHPMTC
jgi:hypothetical protein